MSPNGNDAGEVDIVICDNEDNPIALLEGLKLSSFKKEYIDAHIQKVLTSYNPFGCQYAHILIYATAKKFDELWKKIMLHMHEFNFPYEVADGMKEIGTAYTDTRHARAELNRNGKKISVHLWAISMAGEYGHLSRFSTN